MKTLSSAVVSAYGFLCLAYFSPNTIFRKGTGGDDIKIYLIVGKAFTFGAYAPV